MPRTWAHNVDPQAPVIADLATEADYRIGFQSLKVEREIDSLEIEGRVPQWLSGSLYRIGPAKFEVGERSVNHWFDGFSMLHRFSITDGRVSYANRFLQSKAYRAATETGEISFSEFATDPCRSLFRRLVAAFRPQISDNANVNLIRLGDELVAMTETPLPIVFDPQTLHAAGVASKAPGEHTTAHPHFDPASGEALFYAVKFGPRSTYRLFARPDSSSQRQIAKLPAPRPSYMHSFGLTERYAVLAEFPFVINPLDLVRSGRPFIENYHWRPDRPAVFTVIDRRSGEVRARTESEPFFCFHHVNAFEEDGALVVDLVAYEDAEIVEALYLGRLQGEGRLPYFGLRRYHVPLDGGEARSEAIAPGMELPRINYFRHNARPYRYAYGMGFDHEGGGEGFLTRIQKADVDAGSTIEWYESGSYPGEAVFVPSPSAAREDDGILLSLVLEPATETSFLLVLDARDLGEICRARVPHPIPFGFHGQFFADSVPRPETMGTAR